MKKDVLLKQSERKYDWTKRCTSVGICLSLVVTMAAGCSSKDKKSNVITADTPYFTLQPLEGYSGESDTASVQISSVTNLGDKIAVLYTIYDDGGVLYSSGGSTIDLGANGTNAPACKGEKFADALRFETDETAAADETDNTDATSTDESDSTDATSSDVVTTDIDEDMLDSSMDDESYESTTQNIIVFYDKSGTSTGEIDISSTIPTEAQIISMTADTQGNLCMLTQTYDYSTMTDDGMVMPTSEIYTFDSTGALVGDPLEIVTDEEDAYFSSFVIDDDGLIYVAASASVLVYKADGTLVATIEGDPDSYVQSLVKIDGKVYAQSYVYTDSTSTSALVLIDADKGEFGESIDTTEVGLTGTLLVGGDGLYLVDQITNELYAYDLDSGEKTDIFKWKYCDVNSSDYSGATYYVLDKDTIFCMGSNYSGNYETNIALLNREKTNPNAGKVELVIGGLGLSWDTSLTDAIYNFNQENEEYIVVTEDYYSQIDFTNMGDESDYLAALTKVKEQLAIDVLSGDGPDMICGSSYFAPFDTLQSKDLLVDLTTLIDGDEDFQIADYRESVINANKLEDGSLYQMPISFSLSGLAGPVSLIGDRTGWTVDEFNEVINSLPSDVQPIVNVTQSTMLTDLLSVSLSDYVNQTEGTVDFSNDSFYQLLDMALTYGSDDDATDDTEYVDEWTLASEGQLALSIQTIYDISALDSAAQMFGEDVAFVGFPDEAKSGLACSLNESFGICTESASQDGCWEFVKAMLSEDTQTEIAKTSQGIPMLNSVVDAQIAEAKDPPTDYEDYQFSYYSDVPLTDELAQKYLDMLDNVTKSMYMDESVTSIVLEEVPAYFNNQKSAEEVSALIQDRVQTLVNERS